MGKTFRKKIAALAAARMGPITRVITEGMLAILPGGASPLRFAGSGLKSW
jgi:hypothetical protein